MAKKRDMSRILVVDDDLLVRQSMGRMLNFLGYEAKLAGNAEEALNLFKKNRFDLVITDYAMPGMNGEELAETIKGLEPGQPVLMISGFTEHLLANSGLRGVDLVVGKPFELGELRRAVSQLCEDWDEPQMVEAAD